RRLSAAGRSHEKGKFTARERETHALESLHLTWPASKNFHDVDGLHHGFCLRVKTIAGSMRITCTMAEIDDKTHMMTVNRNNPTLIIGVMTTGNADSAVASTITNPMPAAMQNPMMALRSAWEMMTLWIYLAEDPMARRVANSLK